MSLNGTVTIGKWEYISSAKSIMIDRGKDKILLNQEFVEKGLLILKYDGFVNKYFILANENIIPDLNIENYLWKIYRKKFNISIIESIDEIKYEIAKNSISDNDGLIGQTVFHNGNKTSDGCFQSKNSKIFYYVKNSKIYKKSVIIEKKIANGKILFFECFFSFAPNRNIKKGDYVRLSYDRNDFAPDGTYKINFFIKIKVKNGIIIYITW